jgi:ElaB/YqjD/DUF883 family membrane-anchored ribosome-binding protein
VNDQFRIISDLVADAEDLLQKVASAESPQVRALSGKLRHSVNCMENELRDRLRAASEQPSFAGETRRRVAPWVYGVGAAAAIGLLLWMYSRRRSGR